MPACTKHSVASLALLVSLTASTSLGAEHWVVQYFYDQDREALDLIDMGFSSPQNGIAIGNIQDVPDRGRRPRPVAVVTSDGGDHWKIVPLPDHPRSLFTLSDSLAWMVGETAIWSTEDGGLRWKRAAEQEKPDKKIPPPIQGGLILKVSFLDAQHGFAVGLQKAVFETRDGGKKWTPVPEAAKILGSPSYAAYSDITFSKDGRYGVIAGSSVSPLPGDEDRPPPWVDPEHALRRRHVSNPTALLQTLDGGATWKSQVAPLPGFLTGVVVGVKQGLLIFRFDDNSDVPSDVYHMDLVKHSQVEVFREKYRVVCSGKVFEGSRSFLAAIDPEGPLASSPIPGKVKILSSSDLNTWTEMPVSYRAIAHDIVLAGTDPTHMWAATDTGMILKLVE